MGALAVFGFELQTNANLFMSGVKERQVAWRGDNVTLEGDETTDNPDKSELEFVTAPCVDRATALRSMASARKLAAQLRVDAGLVHGNLTFAAGQAYAGGVWERACTVRIENFPFAAAPQVTVGVPLARMREFVTAVLNSLGDTRTVEDLAGMATQAKQVMTHFQVPDSAELEGFLWACRYFLLRAKNLKADAYRVDDEGRPLVPGLNQQSWRVFQFESQYLSAAGFGTGAGTVARIAVNRDSPKSAFGLLHRTDFHSMFTAIPADSRAKIDAGLLGWLLWPYNDRPGDPREFHLLPFPYRADPLDANSAPPAVKRVGQGWQYKPTDVPGAAETWDLMEHGPGFAAWCASVIDGRLSTEPGHVGQTISKDLASPPPGLQGRPYQVHKDFPGRNEDKSTYYGMGVFPMDPTGGTPLAIYEHRSFRDDVSIKALLAPGEKGLVAEENWEKLVNTFCDTYLKF